MHFKNYPHDTQECNLEIESSKNGSMVRLVLSVAWMQKQIIRSNPSIDFFSLFTVSHTTDDLIFIWDPQMPLDVDKGIELPQLELMSTNSDDCTTVYSTGNLNIVFFFILIVEETWIS